MFQEKKPSSEKKFSIKSIRAKRYPEKDLSKRSSLALKPVLTPMSDIETHLKLKEYKAQFRYIVSNDLKEIEYYTGNLIKNIYLH